MANRDPLFSIEKSVAKWVAGIVASVIAALIAAVLIAYLVPGKEDSPPENPGVTRFDDFHRRFSLEYPSFMTIPVVRETGRDDFSFGVSNIDFATDFADSEVLGLIDKLRLALDPNFMLVLFKQKNDENRQWFNNEVSKFISMENRASYIIASGALVSSQRGSNYVYREVKIRSLLWHFYVIDQLFVGEKYYIRTLSFVDEDNWQDYMGDIRKSFESVRNLN